MATTPPTVAPGGASSASRWPFSARTLRQLPQGDPGLGPYHQVTGACSRIRSIRVMSVITSQRAGGGPQEIVRPLPRGTTVIPRPAAAVITPAACSIVPG